MNAKELREKSISELKTALNTLRRKQFKLRLLKSDGEFKSMHEIKQTRRAVARAETILTEKEGKSHE